MTNAGKRHFRIESHLHVELVKRHSPSFPWKEVPRRGGGWHRRGLKSRAGGALSRIVIPSAAEGSFSFAIFCFMCESVCMKHRSSGAQGVRCFPLADPLTYFALTANEKDFSLSLEMTNARKRHSRIESHLYEESVKRSSPSFPWKEVPQRGRGWHRAG